MTTLALIGVGNIGFRHFQAACATDQIDRILLLDQSRDRLDLALASSEAKSSKKSIEAIDSLDGLSRHKEKFDFLISALMTDVQANLYPKFLALKPRYILLEKPVAQSQATFDLLLSQTAEMGQLPHTFVNCSRNLGTGVGRIREALVAERTSHSTKIHLEVTGNLWGLGCNMLHFTELFRYLTDARSIDATSAQIMPSPFGNKRGAQYEEFLGTASFVNDQGDTLQISCGAAQDVTSGISILIKNKVTDAAWFLVEEKPRRLTSFTDMSQGPLGDLFVSESTRVILKSCLGSPSVALAVPTLETLSISHKAFLDALALGLKRTVFQVT